MLEQQLIDYITKAKAAGQSDEQTRSLLYKNGWTETEVGEAFSAISQPQPVSKIQPEPEIKSQPEPATQTQQPTSPLDTKPQPEPKTEPQIQQPQIRRIQTQPQPVTTAMPESMPHMKHQSNALLKTLIVLVILVVLGGAGYFVAGQYISLPWNPFGPSSEMVMSKMIENMGNAKFYSSASIIEADVIDNASKTPQGKFLLNVNSEIDSTDSNNIKATGDVKANFTAQGSDSPVISFDVNTVAIGSSSYLKINNIIIPNELSLRGLDMTQINGKWFLTDKDSIKTLSQISSSNAVADENSQIDNLDLAKQMKDFLTSEGMLSSVKKLKNENIGDNKVYHYSAKINNEKLKGLINKISSSVSEETIQPIINNFILNLGDINIDMWIGVDDYMLYQYKISKTFDLNPMIGMPTSLNLKIESKNSNFNKSITVQAPEGAQKIEEVVGPVLKIQKIELGMRQIGALALLSYNDSSTYSSLCAKRLLNGYLANYGEDLVKIHTNIVAQGAQKPACFANDQNYCVSTQLANGNYICVGVNGIGATKCISASTVCK
ncbi:MAG: hypothetical protein WC711_00465 [Candidatus Staskawiczbacteria bacterium]|jgi:hypothetical protein